MLALTTGTALACAAGALASSKLPHRSMQLPHRSTRLPHRSTQARFASVSSYRHDAAHAAAITYDRAAVPVGSWVRVTQAANRWGGMDVRLQVRRLLPNESYRAEVHVDGCSVKPSGAGPAFQNGPSHQDYAANEFWLNFRTDRSGDANVLTQQYWGIGVHQHAGSVVIHTPGSRTATAACVSVPFRRIWDW